MAATETKVTNAVTAIPGAMVRLEVGWFDRERHPEFVAWYEEQAHQGLATWGSGHAEDEYADCFVGVDPSFGGDGTDSSMPDPYWSQVVEQARQHAGGRHNHLHVIVWITPHF